MDRTTEGTFASSPIATTADLDLDLERWRSLDELVTAIARKSGEPGHCIRRLLHDLCLDAVRPMRVDDGEGRRSLVRDVGDRSLEAILEHRLAGAEARRRAPGEPWHAAEDTVVEWPLAALVAWMVRVGLEEGIATLAASESPARRRRSPPCSAEGGIPDEPVTDGPPPEPFTREFR